MISANKIRRQLREHDIRPHSNRNREGVRIRQDTPSMVLLTVDYDSVNEAERAAEELARIVQDMNYNAWHHGNTVEVTEL